MSRSNGHSQDQPSLSHVTSHKRPRKPKQPRIRREEKTSLSSSLSHRPLRERLLDCGVSAPDLLIARYSEPAILKTLEEMNYAKARGAKLRNPGGFLHWLLKQEEQDD